MAPAARSPAPPPAHAAPPSRLRRWGIRIGIALLLLAVVAWGAFTWFFFNPFEGRVGRLERVVPPTVAVAVRGSAAEILGSPFVQRRVLAREDVSRQIALLGLDEAVAGLERTEAQIDAQLPGFLKGFRLREDLVGTETLLFAKPGSGRDRLRSARAAFATRLSFRGRLVLSVLKHDWIRRRVESESGVALKRYAEMYEIDLAGKGAAPEWTTVYAALVRDVLVAGNDRDLVAESARLARTGGLASLADRADAGRTFSEDSSAPLRAFADVEGIWPSDAGARPGELLRDRGGLPGLLGFLLDPDLLATAQVVARFPDDRSLSLEVAGVRSGGTLSALPADLADGQARPAAEALQEAALLAPAGSAVLAARLEASPGALFRLLYGRASADVRKEVEAALRDARTGIEELARDLDDALERGVSVVVERLPECDALAQLDRYQTEEGEKFVLPLPGLLFVLREKSVAEDGAAERTFRRLLADWKARLVESTELEGLPAGMRGLRFRPGFLTGEKALVVPAVAFEGDLVLLSSNEGLLRRALEARAGKRPSLTDFDGFADACRAAGDGQGAAFLEIGAAIQYLKDQRREVASALIEVDPIEERKRIFQDVAVNWFREQQQVQQKDIEAETERRMEAAQKERETGDFPREQKKYVESLEGLREVSSVSGALAWDRLGLRLHLLLRAAGGAK